jgi:6-phosphogluconolactonase (cycloisomerase 2 family)
MMLMSPDGRNVYTIGGYDNRSAIAVLVRDAKSGTLHQLRGRAGCLLPSYGDPHTRYPDCLAAPLNNPAAIAITPDGRELIWTNPPSPNTVVAAYARSTRTGALSPLPCYGICGSLRAAPCADGIATSPDNGNVYVTSDQCTGRGLAILQRDPATGQLTQPPGTAGCIQRIGADGCAPAPVTDFAPLQPIISPDGRMLYVTSVAANRGLFLFSRDPATGLLTAGPCYLEQPEPPCTQLGQDLDLFGITPDGRHAYATNDSATQVFTLSRDPSSGALTTIATTRLPGAYDSIDLYASTLYVQTDTSITVYARDPDGTLHLLPPASRTLRFKHLWRSTVFSPDGRFAYTATGTTTGPDPERIVTLQRTR